MCSLFAPRDVSLLQEELDLKPGHSFLDVGSGCGIIAACAAYLASFSPPRYTCRPYIFLPSTSAQGFFRNTTLHM